MLVPVSWLREFVPVEEDPDAIADRLSLTGLAVEQVIRTGQDLSGVVVGEVRSVREHPDADSLMLVVASDGQAEHDIVCGARNYVVGDRIPLALPGAYLPNGMDIAAREVRGEASNGMLCSARELGLGEDHTGILLLDADAPLGKTLGDALELDDAVLDVDVTPNRPDALSIVGVAREVAAIYGLPFQVAAPATVEEGEPTSATIAVEISDARGCPRYVARVIRDVKDGRSPWWLRRRLYAAGMRPISTLVDITNYVMLERGQPLHAFDASTLRGAKIVVRRPGKGEGITTLDGVDRILDRTDVTICDAEGPVAIGGIMGGAATEVGPATTDIVLEAAHFDPIRITRSVRRLGLRSEASFRFERGADPEAPPAAAARAAELFALLAGGTVAPEAIDVYPKPRKARPIRLTTKRATTIIGSPQDPAAMAGWLRAVGCTVTEARGGVRATPPSWRPDITIEDDLIEEVARLQGYDSVPSTLPTGARTGGLSDAQRRREQVRDLMVGAGTFEARTLSLLPPDMGERLSLPAGHPWRNVAALENPLSADESVLRPSLLPGLLLAARFNVARGVTPVRLFEIGTTFTPDGDGVDEVQRLAFVLAGHDDGGWLTEDRALDASDAVGLIEALARGLGMPLAIEQASEHAPFHPGRVARVVGPDGALGWVGEIHPRVGEGLELPARVAMAELDLGPIAAYLPPAHAAEVSRMPAIKRDVAVIVPDALAAEDVRRAIADAGGPLVEDVFLFDVYRGDPVLAGHVSLAFSVVLRDAERTLTEADADAALEGITRAAGERGWTIRD